MYFLCTSSLQFCHFSFSFPVSLHYILAAFLLFPHCPHPSVCCPVLPSLGPQRHSLLFLIKNNVPFVCTGPYPSPHNHLSLNWVTVTPNSPQMHVHPEDQQQACQHNRSGSGRFTSEMFDHWVFFKVAYKSLFVQCK